MFFVLFLFSFRDKYGATPKDRLSEEEENYGEIVSLLNRRSGFVPPQKTSGVSGLMSSLALDFCCCKFHFSCS